MDGIPEFFLTSAFSKVAVPMVPSAVLSSKIVNAMIPEPLKNSNSNDFGSVRTVISVNPDSQNYTQQIKNDSF